MDRFAARQDRESQVVRALAKVEQNVRRARPEKREIRSLIPNRGPQVGSICQAKVTRAFVLIWLTVVAAMPVSAHAMGSARDRADDCRTLVRAKTGAGAQIRIPFTKKALVCWGYMQAMQDLSGLADEDGRRIMGACPPERTTLLELIQAFVSYARLHADELPDNAALAVARALQEAFPCGASGLGFRRPSRR